MQAVSDLDSFFALLRPTLLAVVDEYGSGASSLPPILSVVVNSSVSCWKRVFVSVQPLGCCRQLCYLLKCFVRMCMKRKKQLLKDDKVHGFFGKNAYPKLQLHFCDGAQKTTLQGFWILARNVIQNCNHSLADFQKACYGMGLGR